MVATGSFGTKRRVVYGHGKVMLHKDAKIATNLTLVANDERGILGKFRCLYYNFCGHCGS